MTGYPDYLRHCGRSDSAQHKHRQVHKKSRHGLIALFSFRPTNAANLLSRTCPRHTLFMSVPWQRARNWEIEGFKGKERESERHKENGLNREVERETPAYQRGRQHKSPLHTHSLWGFMIPTGRKQAQKFFAGGKYMPLPAPVLTNATCQGVCWDLTVVPRKP